MFDRLERLLPEINRFLQNGRENFTLQDLKNYIGLKNFDDDILSTFLISFSLAYFFPDPDLEGGIWVSKHGFFSGKEFPIQISHSEQNIGMFVPASRFLPFLPANKQAHDIKIFYEKKEISKKKIYLSFDRISSLYFLYTENDISNALCEDYEENIDAFACSNESFNTETLFAISAWDFSDIFDEINFNFPMRFFVRIKDWSKAEFEIIKKRPEISEDDIADWFNLFESAVRLSLQILPIDSSTYEILSFAYFLGENIIFSKKAAPMELFFERKNTFGIVPYGIEEKFWAVDEPIRNPENWFERPFIEDTIDEFFESIKRPITAGMIKCFVLDFLSLHYVERFDKEIKLRFIDDGLNLFIPKFLPNYKNVSLKCKKYLEDYYDTEIKFYNPFNDAAAKDLRSSLVYFYTDLILFFNEIEERKLKTADFTGQSPLMLYQIFEKVFQWCSLVSSADPEDRSFFEIVFISLENLSYVYADVKVEIRNKISALT